MTNALLVRNLGEAYVDATGADARHARAGPLPVRRTGSSTPSRATIDSRPHRSSSPAGGPTSSCSRSPTGGCSRSGRWATSTTGPSSATGQPDWRTYRVEHQHGGPEGRATARRPTPSPASIYGLSTAYHMTGEDRFLEAAEAGVEYLRDHLRHNDPGEGIVVLVPRHRHRRTEREEDPRLGVRRRLRRHPGVRADLRAGRAAAQVFRITRRSADPGRHRRDGRRCSRSSSTTPSTAATGRTSTRDLRPAQRFAGPEPGAQELELGRRPRPGLPDQRVARDRRAALRRHAGRTGRHDRPALPGRRATARSCRSASTRTGAHDTTWGWQQNRAVVGHNLKIAWNLMRIHHLHPQRPSTSSWPRRSASVMPDVGSDQQRGGWYDVVERGLEPGQDASTASRGMTARRGGSRSRPSSPT